MKRIFCVTLTLVLLLSTLTACKDDKLGEAGSTTTVENTPQTDIWDGTVASAFEGGAGTEADPYKIAKASQLAFLAKSVNEGTSYSDKYLTLTNDIDLNNIEWTPIGNGDNPFEGNFNGNHFIIRNLKISKVVEFIFTYGNNQSLGGLAGLFGFCGNINLRNLNVHNASISLGDIEKYLPLCIGTLVARIESTANIKISGIKIDNSNIVMKTNDSKIAKEVSVGGLAGIIKSEGAEHSSLNNIQCDDISILYGDTLFSNCHIGGIIGGLTNRDGYLEVSNFASYLTTEMPSYRVGVYYFGAFGDILTTQNGQSDLSNGFSKLSIDKKDQGKYGYSNYVAEWYSIVGYLSTLKNTPSYNFKNLFGFVVQTDKATNEQQIFTQLYVTRPPSTLYTENNCKGCEALPENHGFDANIWNLSDLSKPKLK